MADNGNLIPFKKDDPKTGYKDPRINRLGKPKTFDQLRKLAQKVLHEAVVANDGTAVSRVEAMLKLMSSSRDPADRNHVLAIAYGKVPEKTENDTQLHVHIDNLREILHKVYGSKEAEEPKE